MKVLFDAINSGKKFYKVNLHSHSIYSDGHLTVEEVKKLYKEHGYSAVAFTDHDIFLTHNDLTDDEFVALNGSEYGIYSVDFQAHGSTKNSAFHRLRTHLCLVAKDPSIKKTPIFKNAERFGKASLPYKDLPEFDENLPDFKWEYTKESTNELISRAKEAGFFVTYNHPDWSYEKYPVYSGFEGMDAFEIMNGGSVGPGGFFGSEEVWRDFIRQGKKVYAIAADDNHNDFAGNDPKSDAFSGYVKVLAERLSYADLIKGLEKGEFIAGTGDFYHESPDILSVEYDEETRKVHVKTTEAFSIACRMEGVSHLADYTRALRGETITEGTFSIHKECHIFRIVARSTKGYETFSQCFYIDGRENLDKVPSFEERQERSDV